MASRGKAIGRLHSLGIAACLAVLLMSSSEAGLTPSQDQTLPSPAVAPALLASVEYSGSGWARGVYASLRLTFSLSEDFMGFQHMIGEAIAHRTNETGRFDFTPANESEFEAVRTLLTNGRDDVIGLGTMLNGGGGEASPESYRLGGNPDLVTYSVDLIRLVIQVIWIYPDGEGTSYQHLSTWEIWGRPLEVAYVPPTDPDGTILTNRTYTVVATSLRTSGVALLEWDGVNQTMDGTGAIRSRNKTGIPNGVHTYRVWANDSTGTWYATEARRLFVQVGWWRGERITYGFLPSLDFDANGIPHLCAGGGSLLYANRASGAWRTEVVDGRQGVGLVCSLALDAAGLPHISYEDESAYSGDSVVMYAHHDGAAWALETVEATSFTTYTSLAIDPTTGEPWIAFYESGGRDLKIARRSGGTWTSEVVDTTGDVGGAPALDFTAQGVPGIAYARYDTGALRFASRAGGIWQTETIEPTGTFGGWDGISLRFDAGDTPRIAYAHASGLMYAARTGGTWAIEAIEAEPASAVALDVDAQGRPRIAYGLGYSGDILYSTKDGTWTRELLAERAFTTGIALAGTPQDIPAIVHGSSAAFGDLVYALRVQRAPIRIDGDAGFTPANGVVHGAGRPEDPYVIEGWHVDALGGPGISIRGTRAPFLVRGLSIRSGGEQFDGILLENVTNGTIVESRISDNLHGIRVLGSSTIAIIGNELSSNGLGISLEGSVDVQVHGNRFEGNLGQASDDAGSANAWDLGYPSGGNFWSDYPGLDRCRGPAQDVCPSPDGIGDSPYAIDADSLDRYPLLTPNALPVPSFTVSADPLFVGDHVEFDATGSMDPDGEIASYGWDFGDGATGSGVLATHPYAAEGAYTVALTVTDDRDVAVSASRTVDILAVPILPLAPFHHASGFRLPVPVGWEVREDQVIEGTTVELLIVGPYAGGVQTNVLVETDVDGTVREDPVSVDALANEVLQGVRADDPSVEVIETPRRRQIGGHAGFTLAVRYPFESIVQKVAVVLSDEHDRFWFLILTVSASRYREMNATFEAMIAGFEITSAPVAQYPGTGPAFLLSFLLIVILGAGVSIAIFLIMWRGRARAASPPPSVPFSPLHPSAPAAASRFCPRCGTPSVVGQNFCGRCGGALPPTAIPVGPPVAPPGMGRPPSP